MSDPPPADLPSRARALALELHAGQARKGSGISYVDGHLDPVAALVRGAGGTDAQIAAAVDDPPQTTRARLRGEFVRRAKERKRDYTVDWVHLKLNDQARTSLLCKDPFKAADERVDALIRGR